ncbi:MAG: hypothetical protein GWN29_09485, partial [Gammaproteobacteria bacterium]|nr:hypothetical protein [Gammaproteobacteria bacterium]
MDAVIAHHHLGNLDESAENLAKLEPLVEQFGAWPTLAMTYAQIGRIDDALDIFDDKIFAERPVVGLFWRTEPLAEPLFGN